MSVWLSRYTVFFTCFPFSQILPLATYNQPYAILFAALCLLAKPSLIGRLPQMDRLALILAVVLGVLMTLINVLVNQAVLLREALYLLSYVTPALLVPVVYFAARHDTELIRSIVGFAVLVWVAVAVIQQFAFPNFLTFLASEKNELGTRLLDSGRGVLGLAPESTHHGFHIAILALAYGLLGGRRALVLVGFLSGLLLARSSSLAIAMALGGLVFLVSGARMRNLALLAFGALTFFIISNIEIRSDTSRILYLLARLLDRGGQALLLDQSANMRFYGVVGPIKYSLESFLLPHGFSLEAWLRARDSILTNNRQIIGLSRNGPASGFGLYLFQAGVLSLPILFVFFKRLCWDLRRSYWGLGTAMCFVIFLSQLYLATPSFALIYGIALWTITARVDRPVPSTAAAPNTRIV